MFYVLWQGFPIRVSSPSANSRLLCSTQIHSLIVFGSMDESPQLQRYNFHSKIVATDFSFLCFVFLQHERESERERDRKWKWKSLTSTSFTSKSSVCARHEFPKVSEEELDPFNLEKYKLEQRLSKQVDILVPDNFQRTRWILRNEFKQGQLTDLHPNTMRSGHPLPMLRIQMNTKWSSDLYLNRTNNYLILNMNTK